MQRIPAVDLDAAPAESKPVLEQVKANFGVVPNIFASVANSPAALKALVGMFGALEEGALAGKAQEAIALRVAEFHRCAYCTAAHTAKARMIGATDKETIAFRRGEVEDPRIQGLLNLATAMVEKRGHVSDGEVQAARDAGLSDGDMLEALATVMVNIYTNYVNALVQTAVDFPAAPPIE